MEFSFRRSVKPENSVGNPVLITFCDASEKAYGACCYLRWETVDGSYKTQLVASKSKVSPVKVNSIVRLKICGALIGKRLAEFFESESRFQIQKKYFIVDSEVVRSMVQKQSYGFNTFVAVRIGEIQEYTDPTQWYWIDSESNIADWITRDREPSEIGRSSTWQMGPSFLCTEEDTWPTRNSVIIDVPEQRKLGVVMLLSVKNELSTVINIDRFSKYLQLLYTTARVHSVFEHKPSLRRMLQSPCSKRLEAAEVYWIKNAQNTLQQQINKGMFARLNLQQRNDGVYAFIRNVDVQYRNDESSHAFETVRRAVQKLILILPVDDNDDN